MSIPPIADWHTDPGLQPERTVMSWGRTAFLLALVASLGIRWSTHFAWLSLVIALGAGVVATSILCTQSRRYRRQCAQNAPDREQPLSWVWASPSCHWEHSDSGAS